MEDTGFYEFLDTIPEADRAFAQSLHCILVAKGCKCQIKTAKSGYAVSYIKQQDKKTLANFVCRKTGIKLRIYPRNISQYEGFLDELPQKMKKEIIKASGCKRLLNPNDCNPKCVMGYDFYMDKEHYQKCRYMAFQFTLQEESNDFIRSFLEKELDVK